MNSLATLIGIFALLAALCWYINEDVVYCSVKGAGYKPIDGYYAALGGVYLKRGYNVTFFPDFFDIVALRRDFSSSSAIGLSHGKWSIRSSSVAYVNTPKHPEEYIYFPPPKGWDQWNSSQGYPPGPEISSCKGTLDESPARSSSQRSNLELLIGRPVSTLLLAAIFYYAYYLWANRVEVSSVAYIYEAIVNGGEYWRIVTSSFAHFDVWHIMFNTMTLYQMADLEDVYGSVQFAYLNADLVVITMAICTWIYHIQITRYGREDLRTQQAVGYSCVLFALMVDASVRMSEFCPLFFLPSFCFKTMYIPNLFYIFGIGSQIGLPVNFGPLILLVVTKVIIPRSSFTGHLAGIIIGYPLAWNMLNWLTPPIAIPLTVLAWVYKDQLLVWKISGYEYSSAPLSEFVPVSQLRRYYALWATFFFLALCVIPTIVVVGPLQLLPRGVFLFLAWSALHSRRIEWITEARTTHDSCVTVIVVAVWAAILTALYDIVSLSGSLSFSSGDLLRGCALSDKVIVSGISIFAINLSLELIFFGLLISCLQDIKIAEPYLQKWRLSAANIQRDVELLGLANCCGLCKNRNVFQGPARTLHTTTAGGGGLGDYSSVPVPTAEEGLDEDGDTSLNEHSSSMRMAAESRANYLRTQSSVAAAASRLPMTKNTGTSTTGGRGGASSSGSSGIVRDRLLQQPQQSRDPGTSSWSAMEHGDAGSRAADVASVQLSTIGPAGGDGVSISVLETGGSSSNTLRGRQSPNSSTKKANGSTITTI